jgi:hypothetical protein
MLKILESEGENIIKLIIFIAWICFVAFVLHAPTEPFMLGLITAGLIYVFFDSSCMGRKRQKVE